MRILVLGGTRFLGRHFVEAARARGHELTLFHRGQSNPGLHEGLPRAIGDRDGGLAALEGHTFDAVLDPSGYLPRVVAQSARAFAGRVARYVFVSTVSVYAEPMPRGADETAPLAVLTDPAVETVTGETYGGLKALCEAMVRGALGERATVVRPGLIVGPHDTTDRFPYWPRRMARGGEVLAPGDPGSPTQVIDARDLAAWLVTLIERDLPGTFNATGPAEPITMRDALECVRDTVNPEARLTWVSEPFLDAQGVQPWLEMPLWVHAAEAAFDTVSIARALAAGLTLRPLADTVRDTLAWERTLPPEARENSPALKPAREAEVLAAWRAASR